MQWFYARQTAPKSAVDYSLILPINKKHEPKSVLKNKEKSTAL